MRGIPLAALLTLVAALAATPAAAAPATETTVTSFDGTAIQVFLMPQPGATPAPTVLVGPGWAAAPATDTDDADVAAVYTAGYNVVTWSPRGFGASGGVVGMDTPDTDGRDLSAIVDRIAAEPWAQLDGPGDPRIGMVGGSYGAGIQYAAATDDHRIDALVPIVGWHSLRIALYPRDTYKAGIARLLYKSGKDAAETAGEGLPPQLGEAFAAAESSGAIPLPLLAWFNDHGPSLADIADITAPTLVVGGTPDTLFALDQQIAIYDTLRTNGTQVKMIWFCGGHGICNTGNGGGAADRKAFSGSVRVERAMLAWLDRWLRGAQADTGRGFEWVSDDGRWRRAGAYPPAAGRQLVATGGPATLRLRPSAGGGNAVAAAPARRGTAVVRLPLTARRAAQVVGAPTLRVVYSGRGNTPATRVFAQLVDVRRRIVVGNQTTPLPLRLDGRRRTLRTELAVIASSARRGGRYELQLVPASQMWAPQSTTGQVRIRQLRLGLRTLKGR